MKYITAAVLCLKYAVWGIAANNNIGNAEQVYVACTIVNNLLYRRTFGKPALPHREVEMNTYCHHIIIIFFI